jgi:hypothetical protein
MLIEEERKERTEGRDVEKETGSDRAEESNID